MWNTTCPEIPNDPLGTRVSALKPGLMETFLFIFIFKIYFIIIIIIVVVLCGVGDQT